MPIKRQLSAKNSPPKAARLGGLRHHAYLLEGNPETVLPALFERLAAELGRPVAGHPDIFLHQAVTFSLEDSRLVRAEARGRPLAPPPAGQAAANKFIILAAAFFTPEAQQALLKTLEDAAPNTHYFLITPNTERLLPTLRSRLERFELPEFKRPNLKNPQGSALELGNEFLAMPLPERLAWVRKLIDRHKDDEDSGPLKKEALEFLDGLEIILHEKLPRAPATARGLENILRARDYLSDRGAMIKMILENLALTL